MKDEANPPKPPSDVLPNLPITNQASPRRGFLRRAVLGVGIFLASASALGALPEVYPTTITTTAFQFANSQIYEESATLGDSIRNSADSAYLPVNALAFQIFATKGDANPTLKASTNQIQFGSGGGSALDVIISRKDSATIMFGTEGGAQTNGNIYIGAGSSTRGLVMNTIGNYVFIYPTTSTMNFGVSATLTPPATPTMQIIATAVQPGSDNAIPLGTSALRWTNIIAAGAHQVFAAASDANPTATMNGTRFQLGLGGASAVDTSLTRNAAGVFGIAGTQGLIIGASTAVTPGTLGTLVCPLKSAAGAPNDAAGGNVDGSIVVSSGDTKIYVRVGGLWKGVAVA